MYIYIYIYTLYIVYSVYIYIYIEYIVYRVCIYIYIHIYRESIVYIEKHILYSIKDIEAYF